jgi:hypothetical protein
MGGYVDYQQPTGLDVTPLTGEVEALLGYSLGYPEFES